MLIPQFLLKPTNVIVVALLVALAMASGSAYYLYGKNTDLHEQVAKQKRDNELYVALHNEQISSLSGVISNQNASIAVLKLSSDKQTQEMGKVQTAVDTMRTAADKQLLELRRREVINLTCDQSIEFLATQAKTLKWGAVE